MSNQTRKLSDHHFLVPTFALATAAIVTTKFIVIGLLPLLARDLAVTLAGRLAGIGRRDFSGSCGAGRYIGCGTLAAAAFLTLSAILFGLSILALRSGYGLINHDCAATSICEGFSTRWHLRGDCERWLHAPAQRRRMNRRVPHLLHLGVEHRQRD